MQDKEYICPHCNGVLKQWSPPPHGGWDHDLFYCDNNACDYFIRGRTKISSESKTNFAYRFCYNPVNGRDFPLITWCGGDLSLLKGRCGEPQKTEVQ
ncbi:MAG: hypothetical protein JW932_01130 [Deltaproteobacteria bacterium]|nr:hypothetical protein [Deltaproteobacteria bacterium]